MKDESDLPKTWTQRIRSEEVLEKYETLEKELKDRTRKDSAQAVGILAINLAAEKLEEKEQLDQEIEDAMP